MAQFKVFQPGVEVLGEAAFAVINAFPDFMKDSALELWKANGVDNPQLGEWYSQQGWMDTLKDISDKYGSNTLFSVGKAIPDNAVFPPDIDNLEKALNAIDISYQMNHRGGEIGFYKVISHDASKREYIMQCRNPYPCDFDRGILTAMARKFAMGVEVELMDDKPSRKNGEDESWYRVTY